MEQLIQSFIEFAQTQPWAGYFMAVCVVCRLFVSFAPESWTEKLPDWLMVVINKLALSSNSMTDNKGNKITKI